MKTDSYGASAEPTGPLMNQARSGLGHSVSVPCASVATIGGHYQRQASPEVWAEVDALRGRVERLTAALTEALDMVVDATRDGNYSVSEHRALVAIAMETQRAETENTGSVAKP